MKLNFVGSGVLINTGSASVFVGSGPFQADVLASIDDGTIRGAHGEFVVEKKQSGFLITTASTKIAFLTNKILKKEVKEYSADVIIFDKKNDKTLGLLKPKLAILKGSLYDAREISKNTSVQVIAAQPEIDLFSYNALGNQKYLLQK